MDIGGREAAPGAPPQKDEVRQRMCEQKRAPRPLASSPLAHVNYLRPPQSWRQFALSHSFACSFIYFVYPTLRQTTGHLFRLQGGPGGPLQKSISVLFSTRVCVWLSHASGKHAPCSQTLGLRHCFQLYSDENKFKSISIEGN